MKTRVDANELKRLIEGLRQGVPKAMTYYGEYEEGWLLGHAQAISKCLETINAMQKTKNNSRQSTR